MALHGLSEEQIREAAWMINIISGISAYLYGIGYDVDQWKEELNAMMEHVKKSL